MTDTQFADDENGAALRHMSEQGVDLTLVHQLDFEFVFSNEKSAREFSEALGDSFETTCHGPEEEGDDEWEVQCARRMVPTHEAITAVEQELEEKAAKLGGEADGWGLMSSPDGSSVD